MSENTPTVQMNSFIRFQRYQITQEIGSGGMGKVYKAFDPQLNRVVAIKLLRSVDKKEHVERFLQEAQLVAKLQHPNIVQVYDIGYQAQQPFFTMEYINGHSLKKLIKTTTMTTRQIVDIMIKVTLAVEHAHQSGIIHRDLKPDNIMLDSDGKPKVMDFGVAKFTEEDKNLSKTGTVFGTPSYMPPEQASGKLRYIDQRSDVYSLGVILYEMLTGITPFLGSTPMQILYQVVNDDPPTPRMVKSKIPKELDFICMKAMNKKRGRRYPSAREFANDLIRFSKGEPIVAKKTGIVQRSIRKLEKNILWVSICTVLLIIIATQGYYLWHSKLQNSVPINTPVPKTPENWCKCYWDEIPNTLEIPQGSIKVSGTIQSSPQVVAVFLQEKQIEWDPDAKIFSTEVDIDYGLNILRLKILTEDQRWYHEEHKITRKLPPKQEIVVRGLQRNGYQDLNVSVHSGFDLVTKLQGGVIAEPIIVDNRVYAGTDNGIFYCIDLNENKKVWSFGAIGPIKRSPAMLDNKVLFTCNNYTLHALDIYSGKEVWKFRTGSEENEVSPLVYRGNIYFGSEDSGFYALDGATGKMLWKYQAEDDIECSAATDGEFLYFGCDAGNIYKLDLQGKEIWKHKITQKIRPCVMIYAGNMYFSSWKTMYGFNLEKQKITWKFEAEEEILTASAVAHDHIYFGSGNSLYAINAKNGRLAWEFPTKENVECTPMVTSNRVYFGSNDRYMYAANLDGTANCSMETWWHVRATPIIYQNKVYFFSTDKHLYVTK